MQEPRCGRQVTGFRAFFRKCVRFIDPADEGIINMDSRRETAALMGIHVKIRMIKGLGLTAGIAAPMLGLSSCSSSSEPNALSMLMMAPVILPIAGIYAGLEAEERMESRRLARMSQKAKAQRQDGPFTEFWPNGKKRAEGTYMNKELSGVYKSWHENGRKDSEGSYLDGEEHGIWKAYTSDGSLDDTTTYKHGKRDGPWIKYSTNSAGRTYKVREVMFKDGTKHGLTTEWRENGQKSREQNFTNGGHGDFTSWYENGKTASETIYGKDGKRIIHYYRNGQRRALWEYDRKDRKIAEKAGTINGEEETRHEPCR